MKLLKNAFGPLLIILFIVDLACNKTEPWTAIPNTLQQVAVAPLPQQMNFNCAYSPDYGDSIVYLQPTNGNKDYIIMPVNADSLGKGTYLAWPAGLIIDSSTGAINLSQSETGLRYVVGFVKQGTRDTCVKNLVVAGITYVDSMYVLSNNDTLARPQFNANAAVPPVCDSSDNSDYPGNSGNNGHGNNKCVFDGMGKNGKSGQANAKKVKVRTISGIINLMETYTGGAFGSNPADGTSITVPVYYNLNDKSKKATQLINVQLVYYAHLSAVPDSLVNAVQANRAAFYQNIPLFSLKPRPPVIVVIHYFQ